MRLLLPLIFLFFSASVLASEPYQWYWESLNNGLFSTPMAACADYVDKTSYPPGTVRNTYHRINPRIEPYTDRQLRCRYEQTMTYSDLSFSTTYNSRSIFIYRVGEQCPNPETQTYNPETGECDESCEATIGFGMAHVFHVQSRANTSIPWTTGAVDTPEYVCRDTCRFRFEGGHGGPLNCGPPVGDDLNRYCIGMYTGTGDQCRAGDDPATNNPSPPGDGSGGEGSGDDPLNFPDLIDPDADPTDPSNTCGPGYVWAGSTCVRVLQPDQDDSGGGDSGGGDSGGGGNNGGGGDSGGGDGSGGDGTGGDGSGGDGTGGSGGSGGNGGNGDGEGNGGDNTPSNTCDTPPRTEGDPVQAAIIMQSWYSMCHGEELTQEHLQTGFAGAEFVNADDLDDYLIDNAEELDSTINSIVGGVFASGPSNACPVQDASISTRWGTIQLPWTMSCPIFNVISQVMFWFSYLAAGWILFNALHRSD